MYLSARSNQGNTVIVVDYSKIYASGGRNFGDSAQSASPILVFLLIFPFDHTQLTYKKLTGKPFTQGWVENDAILMVTA